LSGRSRKVVVIICLFGQRYQDGADREKEAEIGTMLLDKLRLMEGFVSYHMYTAYNGEVLGVIRFDTGRLWMLGGTINCIGRSGIMRRRSTSIFGSRTVRPIENMSGRQAAESTKT
jgi:hypothetical protein